MTRKHTLLLVSYDDTAANQFMLRDDQVAFALEPLAGRTVEVRILGEAQECGHPVSAITGRGARYCAYCALDALDGRE